MPKVHLKDLFKKKEVEPGKKVELEKNDFLALLIAGASIFIPVLLFVLLLVFLFVLAWTSFF